jgi:phosphoribosyl-ATP pyrophosphohydrolase/phosphoribosyl-AMP cyclohydrolase
MTEAMTLDGLAWGESGLLPVAIVDDRTGETLTLAYANREALERTVATRSTYLYSRSRGELWHKGATSGNTQTVVSIVADCDGDALVYRVIPHGPACHTGSTSCFTNELLAPESAARAGAIECALRHLRATIRDRRTSDPEGSYTARLLRDGVDRIGKKIGEEATEVVIAAKNDDPSELVWESADLIYHLLVLLEARGVDVDAVGEELLRRAP